MKLKLKNSTEDLSVGSLFRKCAPVVCAVRASKGGRRVVHGITVRIRAVAREERGVIGRPAAGAAGTAVLAGTEHCAGAVASAWDPQFRRAQRRDVRRAPDSRAAHAPGVVGGDGYELHGYVEAVDEGDVKEVEVAELVGRELD